jgi:nicotinamidase-related amidase
MGAVDDSRRLCCFIYENLARISQVIPSLDTHSPIQIFHSIFLVDQDGRHPRPYTVVSREDIEQGLWRIDPNVCAELQIDLDDGEQHILHYTRKLEDGGKYAWTIWPYHALLGGIGHALVSSVEEAIFFHSIARTAQPCFVAKGSHPLTESYSILGPEVQTDAKGEVLESRSESFAETLSGLDMLIAAGQAKSHCLAWTVEDLLVTGGVQASRIYLLEDCTSPVVVPGLIDYTEEAADAFRRFEEQGVHLVKSTDPLDTWPGVSL